MYACKHLTASYQRYMFLVWLLPVPLLMFLSNALYPEANSLAFFFLVTLIVPFGFFVMKNAYKKVSENVREVFYASGFAPAKQAGIILLNIFLLGGAGMFFSYPITLLDACSLSLLLLICVELSVVICYDNSRSLSSSPLSADGKGISKFMRGASFSSDRVKGASDQLLTEWQNRTGDPGRPSISVVSNQ